MEKAERVANMIVGFWIYVANVSNAAGRIQSVCTVVVCSR